MEQIQLCDNGPLVSPIIYSFWRWMENTEGILLKSIEKKVNTCLELGINTFDHADIYGDYQLEALFGKALQQKSFKREDIVISTKCGINNVSSVGNKYRIRHFDLSPEHIIESVKASLKNFRTDYIDILLLHHPDPLMDAEETGSALTYLVNKGYVRHVGVANFSVYQHRLLKSRLSIPIVSNHLELNVLNTTPLRNGTIDFIKEQFSRPLAWAPLAGGRLVDENDERSFPVRTVLKRIALKYNRNVEEIAIAWLLKLGALPIIGTNSIERISNAVKALTIELDRQDWHEIFFAGSLCNENQHNNQSQSVTISNY